MSAPVEIGDILAGKYRIERVLGAGGMGVVVAATHLRLDQLVAIKFLLPSALESDEVVERFAREARAASKIQSEHVARVIDVGELESGSPYMVMEYLEGSDLSDILHAEARLPIARAVDYLLEACEALAEAHAAGIVHRDLKPANLFLANRPDGVGIVKVLDFGISKASADANLSAARLTGTAVIMGSPLYMSPEQLRSSRDVDARSDLWALGVIFFELITGQTPFLGETVTEIIANIMTEDAPLASSLRDDVPPGLDAVISLCLAKKRDKRYESVADLATELAPYGTPAAQQSADLIRRVLRVSLSARESSGGAAPTARLSGIETIREPEPRPGIATEAPVSVGARTVVDGERTSEDAVALENARAFGGDTAMSPTSLQGKRVEDEIVPSGAAIPREERWKGQTAALTPTAPPEPEAPAKGVPPAAWAIGAVVLLGFAGVALSRGGSRDPAPDVRAAGADPRVAISATTSSVSGQQPVVPNGSASAVPPTISPAESAAPGASAAPSASSVVAARPAGKTTAKPGAATAAATTGATTTPPATTAPPATTTPPAVVNPLDKLNKVQ